jgi:hypothetical protein
MTGEADPGGPASLRIHRRAAFRWTMPSRHAYDSETTTGCRICCPVAGGEGRAGRCARRRGSPRSSAPELLPRYRGRPIHFVPGRAAAVRFYEALGLRADPERYT